MWALRENLIRCTVEQDAQGVGELLALGVGDRRGL